MKEIYKDDTYKIIGKNLRKLRLAYGLTQEKVGAIAGVNGTRISAVEISNKVAGCYLQFERLLKICNYFGVTLDELCNDKLTVTTNINIEVKIENES